MQLIQTSLLISLMNNMMNEEQPYLPQGFPNALLAKEAPANPAANPKAAFCRVCPPKIRLLVFLFLLPPLVHGLNNWLAKYWVATPRAAPAAPASIALFPVKNLVL